MNPYEKIINFLKANSVTYQEIDHAPIYTVEDSSKNVELPVESGAKALLLKTKSSFVLAIMSGPKKLDSKKLKKSLGVKDIRFATPAEVHDRMGCVVGACYPFGTISDVKTFLDKSLLDYPRISFSPGVHDKTVIIELDDYMRIEKPQVIDMSY